MKYFYKLKNHIKKYPILSIVLFLFYVVGIIFLIINKMQLDICTFIISITSVIIGLIIYYVRFASYEQKQLTIRWFKFTFLLPKKNSKKILHIIFCLSGWGTLFGSMAFITFLLKFNWLISFVFFILQCITAIIIIANYVDHKKINSLAITIKSSMLAIIYIFLDFLSNNLGRSIITKGISVSPEQIPTITHGLYWFYFIAIVSILLLLIAPFWPHLAKNRKLLYKLPFITNFLVFISIMLLSQLITHNEYNIINTIFEKTYIADTMNYFKCDNKIILKTPNDSARYLKVDENEFRALYFNEGESNIQLTTYLCNGSDYIEIDIHKND